LNKATQSKRDKKEEISVDVFIQTWISKTILSNDSQNLQQKLGDLKGSG
jgi:hypothetical protein